MSDKEFQAQGDELLQRIYEIYDELVNIHTDMKLPVGFELNSMTGVAVYSYLFFHLKGMPSVSEKHPMKTTLWVLASNIQDLAFIKNSVVFQFHKDKALGEIDKALNLYNVVLGLPNKKRERELFLKLRRMCNNFEQSLRANKHLNYHLPPYFQGSREAMELLNAVVYSGTGKLMPFEEEMLLFHFSEDVSIFQKCDFFVNRHLVSELNDELTPLLNEYVRKYLNVEVGPFDESKNLEKKPLCQTPFSIN